MKWAAVELADYRKIQIHDEFFEGFFWQKKHRNTTRIKSRVCMKLNIHTKN